MPSSHNLEVSRRLLRSIQRPPLISLLHLHAAAQHDSLLCPKAPSGARCSLSGLLLGCWGEQALTVTACFWWLAGWGRWLAWRPVASNAVDTQGAGAARVPPGLQPAGHL